MRACLGQSVKISLPKAYQMKEKSKTVVVKGVPTEFTYDEFKEILNSDKTQYDKAERMKSRRDGRSLQMFQIELKDPAEAEAIISENLTCPQTGIVFKVEEFRAPVSVWQCYTCQISDTRPKIVRLKPTVSSVEKTTHIKDAQIEKKATKVCEL